jgi:ABC-type uncharacterized transport system permease subunit
MNRNSTTDALVFTLAGIAGLILIAYTTPAGIKGTFSALAIVYSHEGLLKTALEYSGPIVTSAIGLSLAYRAGFITIGSEGQVLLGTMVALWTTSYSGLNLSRPSMLLISIFVAGIAGGLLGLIPGILRAYWEVNETLSSLMLNYVVLAFANYLIAGPWRIGPFTQTREVPDIYSVNPLDVLLIAIILALVYELLIKRSKLGVAAEALGKAPKAAYTYTIPITKVLIYISLLQGFAAGVGGALMIMGFQKNLTAMNQSPGYGYMGILVTWMALLDPLLSIVIGYFFSTLIVAGYILQSSGVPFNTVLLIQSLIVLTFVGYMAVRRGERI